MLYVDDILEDRKPSSAMGWAFQQQALLTTKEEIWQMKRRLQGAFQGRSRQNWALLTIFAEKVQLLKQSICHIVSICVHQHSFSWRPDLVMR